MVCLYITFYMLFINYHHETESWSKCSHCHCVLVYILQKYCQKIYISRRFVSIYQVMTLYCFAFIFDVVVIDSRKLQCLGCFQRHNIHTKVRENRSVGSEVERGWHTHRQHGDFICLFYFLKKESGLKMQLSTSRTMCICCYNSVKHGQ